MFIIIDLHLHLDGSMKAKTLLELANKQHINLPSNDLNILDNMLKAPLYCESLNDYLKCFDLPLMVLQSCYGVDELMFQLTLDLYNQGLDYAEIRFAPQLSTNNGVSQENIVLAAINGKNRALKTINNTKFDVDIILCCMRGDNNYNENFETIELTKKYLHKGVVAADLAGAEALFPTKNFKDIFLYASNNNIPFTIHAGEADSAESIKCAIDFGAKRIGHGVRLFEDKELLEMVKKKNICLEMCPTSNVQTKAVKCIEEHPIKLYLDYGIKVTVNTDNMTVSNTTLSKEFDLIQKTFGLSQSQINILHDNAKGACFKNGT